MANGYYQIKMEGEDRDKTAFVTKYGQFVFNRMPFGLSNAPGTFCRALGLVLNKCVGARRERTCVCPL